MNRDTFRNGPLWTVTMDDLRFLVPLYGWSIADQVIAQLDGAVNGVAPFVVGDGRLVVRGHRPWMSARRLESIDRIMIALRERDVPLPEIVPTLASETFVVFPAAPERGATRMYDRLIEVQRYVAADTET